VRVSPIASSLDQHRLRRKRSEKGHFTNKKSVSIQKQSLSQTVQNHPTIVLTTELPWFKGTVRPKNDQIKKKKLLLMKYEHVADVVKFYSCATCVKGVYGGLNATTIHHYLRNVRRKVAPLKSFKFATSKESNSDSFWARGLILASKEVEFCELQSYREFF